MTLYEHCRLKAERVIDRKAYDDPAEYEAALEAETQWLLARHWMVS